jgi:hypothetical protein
MIIINPYYISVNQALSIKSNDKTKQAPVQREPVINIPGHRPGRLSSAETIRPATAAVAAAARVVETYKVFIDALYVHTAAIWTLLIVVLQHPHEEQLKIFSTAIAHELICWHEPSITFCSI